MRGEVAMETVEEMSKIKLIDKFKVSRAWRCAG